MKHHHEKGPVDGIDDCTVNVVLTEANSTICFIISTQFLNDANQWTEDIAVSPNRPNYERLAVPSAKNAKGLENLHGYSKFHWN